MLLEPCTLGVCRAATRPQRMLPGVAGDASQRLCVFRPATPSQNEAALSAPGATNASRNKVLAGPMSALGLAFARLPEAQQQQHQAQLLQLAAPHLPHLGDKLLRKKLLQEPRDKLAAMQDSRGRLFQALPAVRGAAAGGAGAWRRQLDTAVAV